MKFALRSLAMLALFTTMLSSCGSGTSGNSDESAATGDDVPNTPFTRAVKHDTCLFIAHKVREYDMWKASFDLAEPVRQEHGIKAIDIFRAKKDTSMTMVFTEVKNLKKARNYITSDELVTSMERAGVIGTMDLYWMSHQLAYQKAVTDTILMFMSFKVIDYERWENAFLQDYVDEPERDFQVLKVLRGIDDPKEVSMFFAVNDPDYVQRREKDNIFRAKMLKAGVISYPVTYKLLRMDI